MSATSAPAAKFTKGSINKHLFVMGATSSVGLMALFLVDFIDMLFISMLGEVQLAAAIGFAGIILFFTTSVSIGLSIANASRLSLAIGEQDFAKIRRTASNGVSTAVLVSLPICVAIWFSAPLLLSLIGAEGEAAGFALQYLRIIIPSMPLLVLGMCCASAARAKADAKIAMWVTLIGAIVNAVLDPIFIFVLDLGIEGAAWASVGARVAMSTFGVWVLVKRYQFWQKIQIAHWLQDLPPFVAIAIPALLTNLATPIGNAFVTAEVAKYGTSEVAGFAVINRLVPLAFVFMFALSAVVGPVAGQNLAAKLHHRVRLVLINAVVMVAVYVFLVAGLLFFLQDWLIALFAIEAEAAQIVRAFCTGVSLSYLFVGAVIVVNAMLNNIGYANMSTVINFAKATIFTLPFIIVGGLWGQGVGIIIGQALGNVLIGVIAVIYCWRLLAKLASNQ